MRLLSLLFLLSCAHSKTRSEVQHGINECVKVCKMNDQAVESFQFDTGICTCAENTNPTVTM